MRLAAVALVAAVGSGGWSSAEDAVAPVGSPAAREYTAEQVRAAVGEHVERAARDSGGIYRLADVHAGKVLELELVRISIIAAGSLWRVHDPDRRVHGREFFACVAFHPVGAPEGKLYDVDMRVERREDGLVVTDVRIHKEKQLVDGDWVWETRPESERAAGAKLP